MGEGEPRDSWVQVASGQVLPPCNRSFLQRWRRWAGTVSMVTSNQRPWFCDCPVSSGLRDLSRQEARGGGRG